MERENKMNLPLLVLDFLHQRRIFPVIKVEEISFSLGRERSGGGKRAA